MGIWNAISEWNIFSTAFYWRQIFHSPQPFYWILSNQKSISTLSPFSNFCQIQENVIMTSRAKVNVKIAFFSFSLLQLSVSLIRSLKRTLNCKSWGIKLKLIYNKLFK
jgi:hypothetical protein